MRNYKVSGEETPSVQRMTYPVRGFAGIDAYSDENSLPFGRAKEGWNIGFSVGNVVPAAGFKAPEIFPGRVLPQPKTQNLHFTQMMLFPRKDLKTGLRNDRLIGRNEENGEFWKIDFNSGIWRTNAGMFMPTNICSMPFIRGGQDVLLMCPSDGNFNVMYEDAFSFFKAPHLTSLCSQKGRMFGICPETNTLHFTMLNQPLAIEPPDGGSIAMEEDGGRANEVVAFQGAVYVFKENAVMQLKVHPDPVDFRLTKVFQTNSFIHAKSVAVGENAIYFMTDDGLYSFDGYNAVRMFEGINALITDRQWSIGVYYACKYYLATKIKGNSTAGDESEPLLNNAFIVFDPLLGTASIARGIDIFWALPVGKGKANFLMVGFRNPSRKGQIAVVDDSGKLFDTPLEKYWASGETDLQEPARYKILRRAFISTRDPVTVEFVLDGVGYQYPINGSPNAQLININRMANRIQIKIRSTAVDFKIRDMTLEVDLVRRYYGQTT